MSIKTEKLTTIKLDKPFMFEGKKITKLEMKQPLVKYIVTAQSLGSTPAETETHIMAALTSQPVELIEEMHMKDYVRLQEQYKSFLA